MEVNDAAVIVFHGMGQQVPFETLGNIAKKTAASEHWVKNTPNPDLEIQNVPRLGGDGTGATISRARLSLAPKDGIGPKTSVDFFECYWAPITEGKVGLFDVLVFLLRAGWAGILHIRRGGFERHFWRATRRFGLPKKTLFPLGLAVKLVASLIVLGICVLCLLGGHAAQHLALVVKPEGVAGTWILGDLPHLFDRDFFKVMQGEMVFLLRATLILLLPVLAFGLRNARGVARAVVYAVLAFIFFHIAAFWISTLGQTWFHSWTASVFVRAFGVRGLQAVLLSIASAVSLGLAFKVWKQKRTPTTILWINAAFIASAVILISLLLCLSWWHLWGGWPAWDLESFFARSAMTEHHLFLTRVLLVFYGTAALALFIGVRGFLIEYVGDVAAYVSSHTVSKFADIRAQIQAEAFRAACHVYASGYRKVIVVGHSLGSVIAYDTLNGVINHDIIQKKGWKAVEKTKLLLTFGSPLNKIAFIFRAQLEDNVIRESLAAAKQPLLEESHAYRPGHWVNVWSRNDVISGPLEYFDIGEVKPVPGATGPDRFAFTYKEPDKSGSAAGIVGHVALENPPRPPKLSPVIPLIDPKANIPLAAHTQFWDNELVYQVAIRAIEDEGDGHFEGFIKVERD